jgi:hypothetical protein
VSVGFSGCGSCASRRSASAERELGVDRAFGVGQVFVDAGHLGHEQQLVGLQRDRGAGRDVFHRQVERSPVGREAERESSTIASLSIARRIAGRVDLADHAAVHEVDAVDDATGRAVRSCPRPRARSALAIGVFGRPCENAAFDLEAQLARASCAESSATAR